MKHDTVARRLTTVWPLAVSLMTAVTHRADVEAEDAAFEALVRQSAMARAARGLGRVFDAAWATSLLRSRFERSARGIDALNREAKLRAAGWLVIVASTTAFAMDAATPAPLGPFRWVLTALCAVAGVVVLAAAGPLARALGDRRS